jgi:transcriptional regulator with XRE-family HTH domain
MAKKQINPIDQYVGSRVRMRRKLLSMSQEKLSDALGLTFQQVQKYENGKNRIGSSRMCQIAQALQTPVAFFYEGAPGQPGAVVADPTNDLTTRFFSLPHAKELAEAFIDIETPASRLVVTAVARTIAGPEKRAGLKRVA